MQLFKTVKNKFHHLLSPSNEYFEQTKDTLTLTEALAALLALIFIYIILLFLGVLLWNEILVKLFKGVNKVNSPFEILGLSILLGLIL
jgi:Trk-type K+ transport system membrane component